MKNNYIIDFIFEFDNINNYPITAYGKKISFCLTYIIPLAFVSFYPTQYFINSNINSKLIYLIIIAVIITSLISTVIFKLGLKRYISPNC